MTVGPKPHWLTAKARQYCGEQSGAGIPGRYPKYQEENDGVFHYSILRMDVMKRIRAMSCLMKMLNPPSWLRDAAK